MLKSAYMAIGITALVGLVFPENKYFECFHLGWCFSVLQFTIFSVWSTTLGSVKYLTAFIL